MPNKRGNILGALPIDATILLFDPNYCIESIQPKAQRAEADWAKRGEMTRVVLNVLRQSKEPLTARDIALILVDLRGLDKSDGKLLRRMTKRAGSALRHAKEKGLVSNSEGPGMFVLWSIDRP